MRVLYHICCCESHSCVNSLAISCEPSWHQSLLVTCCVVILDINKVSTSTLLLSCLCLISNFGGCFPPSSLPLLSVDIWLCCHWVLGAKLHNHSTLPFTYSAGSKRQYCSFFPRSFISFDTLSNFTHLLLPQDQDMYVLKVTRIFKL